MEHRGRERVIYIGPKAQDILRTYLLRDHRKPCFVPSESKRRRNQLRRELRESPMTPSQAARQPKRRRRRPPGTCYSLASYRRAIHRACKRADIEQWSPNRLRHSAASSVVGSKPSTKPYHRQQVMKRNARFQRQLRARLAISISTRFHRLLRKLIHWSRTSQSYVVDFVRTFETKQLHRLFRNDWHLLTLLRKRRLRSIQAYRKSHL